MYNDGNEADIEDSDDEGNFTSEWEEAFEQDDDDDLDLDDDSWIEDDEEDEDFDGDSWVEDDEDFPYKNPDGN